jgi:hypothetical protein
MMRLWKVPLVILGVTLVGTINCPRSSRINGDGGTPEPDSDQIYLDADHDSIRVFSNVDILFVMPNDWSNPIISERVRERGGRELINELFEPSVDPDTGLVARPIGTLHLGVMSMDMGAGRYHILTCGDPTFGDDGALLFSDEESLGCSEITATDCDAATCPWFLLDSSSEPHQISQYLECLTLNFGFESGCGWEQPFEATRAALTRNTTHMDPNAGFFREDAILLIIIVLNEDDCSVADSSLFNPGDETLPMGPEVRCMSFPERLESIESYFDLFQEIAEVQSKPIVVAGIIGVPNDGSWIPGDPIEYLYGLRQVDPEHPESLLTLRCSDWSIQPSPRIAEFITMFGDDGYIASICNEDWTDDFVRIARTVQRHLR